MLTAVLEQGVELACAVAAPRIDVERLAGGARSVAFELPGLSAAARGALRSLPDTLVEFPETSMFFGGVHVARARGSELSGAGDPRRGGSVAVV